jgi:hypothetical protein
VIISKCKCVGAGGGCVGRNLHVKGEYRMEARVPVG